MYLQQGTKYIAGKLFLSVFATGLVLLHLFKCVAPRVSFVSL